MIILRHLTIDYICSQRRDSKQHNEDLKIQWFLLVTLSSSAKPLRCLSEWRKREIIWLQQIPQETAATRRRLDAEAQTRRRGADSTPRRRLDAEVQTRRRGADSTPRRRLDADSGPHEHIFICILNNILFILAKHLFAFWIFSCYHREKSSIWCSNRNCADRTWV